MLFTEVMEQNVIDKLSVEMNECETTDQVNKLYRQARVWVRFHCFYAKACTPEHSQELNGEIKKIRNNNLNRIRSLEGEDD